MSTGSSLILRLVFIRVHQWFNLPPMNPPTAAFYGQNAGRLAGGYGGVGSDYVAALDRAFEKSRKILDVGCGTGHDWRLPSSQTPPA
jgi:ribosomal protein L11 methylase PrmA